jgi:hypothetical protein
MSSQTKLGHCPSDKENDLPLRARSEINFELQGVVLKKMDPENPRRIGSIQKKDKTENQKILETEKNITTLRLPIFCNQNKPFIYLKVINDNEKYRLSLNPEFLKNYNLHFKILRDQSLIDFLKHISFLFNSNANINPIIKKKNPNKNNSSIYLKLPNLDKQLKIDKHTIILENDNQPGKTIIDKYQIYGKNNKKTSIFIIDRYYGNLYNSSISFISEEYESFQEFILDYSLYL